MEKQYTCFFTGHRDLEDDYQTVFDSVCKSIQELYSKGVRDFIAGGAIGFDTLCAKAVLKLKSTLDIKLHIYVPCKTQDRFFSDEQKKEYNEILSHCDSQLVLFENYTRWCMHARNKKMTDDSCYCIAYLKKTTGGTVSTVVYAEKKGIEIIFI